MVSTQLRRVFKTMNISHSETPPPPPTFLLFPLRIFLTEECEPEMGPFGPGRLIRPSTPAPSLKQGDTNEKYENNCYSVGLDETAKIQPFCNCKR